MRSPLKSWEQVAYNIYFYGIFMPNSLPMLTAAHAILYDLEVWDGSPLIGCHLHLEVNMCLSVSWLL